MFDGRPGDRVRVIDGTFVGKVGIVMDTDNWKTATAIGYAAIQVTLPCG